MSEGNDEDGLGGRRDYDPDNPLIGLMEQRLLRAFEKGLAETRHMMRGEIATLGMSVAGSQEKATQEHALVQLAIVEMRGDIAELRSAVAEIKPIKEDVARLKSHEDAEDARELTAKALREDFKEQRRDLRNALLGLCGLIVTATGVLIAALS